MHVPLTVSTLFMGIVIAPGAFVKHNPPHRLHKPYSISSWSLPSLCDSHADAGVGRRVNKRKFV